MLHSMVSPFRLLIWLLLACSTITAWGQSTHSRPNIADMPFSRAALLIEGGGRAFWYNLGAELRFPVQENITAVAQVSVGIVQNQVLIPLSAGAFIGNGPHYAEITVGLTPLASTGLSGGNVSVPIYDVERVLTHLCLGYRWNATRRNFMLRAGYNPLFGAYQGRRFLWLGERSVQHWFYAGAVFDIQPRLRQTEPYRPGLEGR